MFHCILPVKWQNEVTKTIETAEKQNKENYEIKLNKPPELI